MENLESIIYMGISIGVIALTVTKADIFAWLRNRLEQWYFIHKLFSCPYCFSHWLSAAMLIIYPVDLMPDFILGYVISWLVTVFIASISAGIIFKLFSTVED